MMIMTTSPTAPHSSILLLPPVGLPVVVGGVGVGAAGGAGAVGPGPGAGSGVGGGGGAGAGVIGGVWVGGVSAVGGI